jgi:Flp pilus assembly CpaF family ATPase
MANVGLPHTSIREAIALAIHLVVHLERVGTHRCVTQVVQVHGYDPRQDQFVLESVIGFPPGSSVGEAA